ncbi:MAG TPA: GTP cyclohydrolase I, partial [Anaerolineae bacterium]|nr:GTP cyclohydrolase I [Anaerolineae bacterium]
MTSLKINNQAYDLLRQEFPGSGNGNGNGNGYHHVHDHDHETPWLDDDFITAEDTQYVMEGAVRQILESIGEDPERQGLQRTPLRVAKAYA